MYGYQNIPETNARVELRRGKISRDERIRDRMAEYLANNGFYECTTYSFAGAADYAMLGIPVPDKTVRIMNPLGEDRAFMRQTLVPAMLRTVALNLNRGTRELRLFETARAFMPSQDGQLPVERPVMCVAMAGEGADFGAIRSIIADMIYRGVRCDIQVRRAEVPWLSSTASGEITVNGLK